MINLPKQYKLKHEKVVWGKLDNKFFILILNQRYFLDEKMKSFYWVPESAIDILDRLLEDQQSKKIINFLAKKYALSIKKAALDFKYFLRLLKKKGLVVLA